MLRRRVHILLIVLVLLLLAPTPAKADPHAVFYTAIGQQQLFFNILAALNQADFVEPATNTTGTSSGISREELLEGRSGTRFGSPSGNEVLESTQTQLASSLTRNITLEGYDLWTAYLLQQRANDFQARIAAGELGRLLCQNALGVEKCDPTDISNINQGSAIIDDYVNQRAEQLGSGALAALLSGAPGDEERRENIIEQIKDGEIPPNPHEYNSYIAALWRLATNNDPVEILLGSLLGSTIGGLLPPAVDVTIYDNLRVENGQFKPSYDLVSSSGAPPAPDSGELTGLNYLSAYTSDLYRLFRQPAALTAAAQAGQERVALEQQADQDGFRAEKSFRAGRNQDGATTRISTRVNVPSESRVADTLAAKQLGVVADTSIRSAPVEGQNVPGDITLTDSPDSSSDGTAPPAPPGSQVNGATSTGQVQGITDGLTGIGSVVGGLAAYYDLGRLPQDVSSNIAPAHDEEGLAATLTGFNPGFSEDGSAGWPSVLNQLIDAASN